MWYNTSLLWKSFVWTTPSKTDIYLHTTDTASASYCGGDLLYFIFIFNHSRLSLPTLPCNQTWAVMGSSAQLTLVDVMTDGIKAFCIYNQNLWFKTLLFPHNHSTIKGVQYFHCLGFIVFLFKHIPLLAYGSFQDETQTSPFLAQHQLHLTLSTLNTRNLVPQPIIPVSFHPYNVDLRSRYKWS